MARTKKQTLVNACERRRQIQEEICKETLAAKQKKETLFISHSRENHSSARTKSPQNGITVSGAQHTNIQKVNLEKVDNSRDCSSTTVGICLSASVMSQANMSSLTQASDSSSPLSEGSLPKAVICIPDICRSPTKSANEDSSLLDSRDLSSRGQVVWGKASSDSHHVKQREDAVRKRLKQSDKYSSSEDVIESLKSLKAASEKVREEKRKKPRHETGTTLLQTPSPGRRSPRKHSPVSSDSPQGINKKEYKDFRSVSDEKPKINIFTDNLGLDLGKRIRSPRRLSEDMIALPIFSARRWSSSPKENPAGCKAGEEMPVSDGMETFSLHENVSSESFKSPCVSPTSNKRSSTCGTSHKTSSPSSCSKFILSDDLLQCMGSKSSEDYISPCTNVCSKSSNLAGAEVIPIDLVNEKSELQRSETECSDGNKLLKSNQLKNSKAVVSHELHSNHKTNFMSRSNQTHDFNSEKNNKSFVFTNAPIHTNVTDSLNIPVEYRELSNITASIKIKKDRTKSKTDKNVDILMSSISKELTGESVLAKCENICVNNTNNSDINIKTDIPVTKCLEYQFNKENSTVNDTFGVNVNSDNSSLKVITDTDKEAAKNQVSCVENVFLGFPQDVVEEKPQSSLLCAMLVGGKEVAHSYSQERVRIKPQSMDTSDSELEIGKGASSPPFNRLSVPRLLTGSGSSELSKEKNCVIQILKSDKLETKDFIESKKLEALLSNCGKIDSNDKKNVTKTSELYNTGAFDHVKMEKDDIGESTAENRSSKVKGHINLSNQLKKLNEGVLKLLEIDLEEEFLKELEVDEVQDEGNTEDVQITAVDNEISKTSLYNLIFALGSRLRSTNNQILDSSAVDIDMVESLIQSCPKGAPSVILKLKTLPRMNRIHKRLEEENLKDMSHIKIEVSTDEDRKDVCSRVDNHSSAVTTRTIYLDSDEPPSQTIKAAETTVNSCNAKGDCLMHPDQDAISRKIEMPSSTAGNVPLDISASSSLYNCHLDPNLDKELPVASSVDSAVEKGLRKCSEVLQTSIDISNKLPHNFNADKTSDMTTKHSFQKSKTCDDFSDRAALIPANRVGTLRRVNSSPQFNAKMPLLPASPSSLVACFNKDSHTAKSKLGSKIPVPGTSYVAKSRKSWRTPRTIVEPKPLSVLSELESKSSQSNNIFMCKNLQKYLNIPSNRIIVTPQRQDEMKILDAKAQEEAETKERMEEADKNEEENLDYKRFEPDFDEVDGMLFMSFFTEVELRAHVRVEKALEWDKDDTMLKVSRVKAFEEAKAQNEDMGHFKLKHLRGQHMRWKKYRRLYSNEVKALLEAQKTGKSPDKLITSQKTWDVSKIKGWKRKNAQVTVSMNDSDENCNWSYDVHSSFSEDMKSSCNQNFVDDDDLYFMSENVSAEDVVDRPDISTRSRRRQGFSHQKAHRQLFRELNMDWQDRMIHRKLGGWSLKGNRPQEFSSAAKKRQEKKSKNSNAINIDVKDNAETISFDELEVETADLKPHNEHHKKKVTKIIYPLLTEKMARNALKTLETGAIHRGMRKKKRSRHMSGQLPALTPVILKQEPKTERLRTPMSDAANISLSSAGTLLTSSVAQSSTSLRSSVLSATMPLEIDLLDEPVMEGVDVASENISSPSVTDTSSLKSCGKPGCRYGCICHLCSVSETSLPLQSPVTKQPSPVCDKEYCRLGCICDSLDPDKPATSKNHCRKPSCMLQCVCPESGNFDGNDDIPYLPSMKRRPKPGERFSNLPQREKTHRSAKNLDAVTRKAMMLYETSEIYCERVERVRKRQQPDTSCSPTATSFDSTLHSSAISPVSHTNATCSTVTLDIDITSDVASEPSEENCLQEDIFKADHSSSEGTPITFSFPVSACSTGSQYHCPSRINMARIAKPTFILNDVRQTVHMMEPSAHKRKRKSHPLSDEIFISSTCARTQPFKNLNPSKDAHFTATSEEVGQFPELSNLSSTDSKSSSVFAASVSTKPGVTNLGSEPRQILPKISSVHTLASENDSGLRLWESGGPEVSSIHPTITSDSPSAKLSKNVTVQKQTSQSGTSSGICAGNSRQPHGWHKSMVCLKARAAPSSNDQDEEDVKEEDEVKLLEFAANCNWEGAKREILARVAQCLTRGQYPQPRTMNVCEFVVEILPKAHQPSHIPPELRAKLPGQMYSIRVRITRREPVSNRRENDPDVIDLSGLSPVKLNRSSDSGDSSVVTDMKELTSGTTDHKSGAASSDSSFLASSSFGISGFSKLFITSPPVSGQNNQNSSGNDPSVNHTVSKPVSAPNSRRSSIDKTAVVSFSDDHRHTIDNPAKSVKVSPSPGMKKGSSFMRLGNESSLKTDIDSSFNNEGVKSFASTAGSSKLKLTSTTASKKSGLKSVNMALSNQPIAAKAVSTGMAPIFGPFSAKDVKYMIPGKDGTMQLIEVGSTTSKNKKLIAVPITLSKTQMDLKCKQSAVVALPVSGMGQSRIVPLLNSQAVPSQLKSAPAQQIVLRLPISSDSSPAVSSVRHPVVLQPLQSSIKGQPPRFQVVPLQIGNCVAVSQAKMVTGMTTQGSKSTLAPKAVNNSDEMIMVFDAAHIKASNQTNSTSHAYSLKTDKGSQSDSADNSASLTTNSRNGPVVSSEISPSKLQTHLNGTIDLTVEKVPLENVTIDSNRTMIEIDDDDSDKSTSDQTGNAYGSEVFDANLSRDSSINLPTNSTDLCLKASDSSSHTNQGDKCSLQTEVSSGSDFKETVSDATISRNLSDSTRKEILPDMVDISKRNSSPSVYCNSPVIVRDIPEPAYTGSKRHIPVSSALEEPVSPCKKKACLAMENPVILDEDSIASLNSMSGLQLAASSPMSSIDRPKSVMSGALSTGSSDDLLVLLSSEEDVDVGEDEKPDKIISNKLRAERALENDHGNMYTRVDHFVSLIQKNVKKVRHTEEGAKTNGLRHDDKDASRSLDKELLKYGGRNLQKVRHHNQLERLRRSRMRALFDELQQHVLRERGLPKNHVMSKVKVLVEAKRVVQQLNRCVLMGDELVKKHERKKMSLMAKLAELKANLIQQNVSMETISSVIKQASEKYLSLRPKASVLHPDEEIKADQPDSAVNKHAPIEVYIDDSQREENLISHTEEEKVLNRPDLTNPAYEDISDPEDFSAQKYEEISDMEENPSKNETLYNSNDL